MSGFKRWARSEIEQVLSRETRQYLVGDLKRPQELAFAQDTRLEIGLTSYSEPTSEAPHKHTEATEFQLVLAGLTEYLDLDSGEEHRFTTGDFYSIEPPTRYAQRSRAGTRILFIKVPSVDDKMVAPSEPHIRAWLAEPIRSTRSDFFHDPTAPKANSLRPAAAVALVNGEDQVLLLRRRDSGNWTLPGGTQELGESLPEAAVRELLEETGLHVDIGGIVGTYSDPGVRVAYSDGEVRQEFTIVFAGRVTGGSLAIDDESTGYRWISLDGVEELPLADSQRRRLRDLQSYLATGAQAVR